MRGVEATAELAALEAAAESKAEAARLKHEAAAAERAAAVAANELSRLGLKNVWERKVERAAEGSRKRMAALATRVVDAG